MKTKLALLMLVEKNCPELLGGRGVAYSAETDNLLDLLLEVQQWGYSVGLEAGRDEGFANAEQAGEEHYNCGHDEGYAEGYEKGQSEGYEDGFKDGHSEGSSDARRDAEELAD